MKTVHGDLLALLHEGTFEVIVHGCNCMGAMVSGLAAQVAAAYPEVEEADREYDLQRPGRLKAGTILKVDVDDGIVINAYTQVMAGPAADLGLIKSAMWKVRALYFHEDVRIGIPQIGCGIGGLDWGVVEPLIEAEFDGMDVTIVEYVPEMAAG